MNNILYQTWNLMDLSLQNDFKADLKESYPDLTTEELEQKASEINNEYFTEDFGDVGCGKLNNNTYEIQGVLGLWDGKHTIIPVREKSLSRAISKCIEKADDFAIGEDRYGNLKICTYHHDGQNLFTIKKVTDKGLRCVNFRREVWGC